MFLLNWCDNCSRGEVLALPPSEPSPGPPSFSGMNAMPAGRAATATPTCRLLPSPALIGSGSNASGAAPCSPMAAEPAAQWPRRVGVCALDAAAPAIRRTLPITRHDASSAPCRSASISNSSRRLNKSESCLLAVVAMSSERTTISFRINRHAIDGDHVAIDAHPIFPGWMITIIIILPAALKFDGFRLTASCRFFEN